MQLVGGHVDATVNNPIEAVTHWRSGTLRPLCVFDGKRLAGDGQDDRDRSLVRHPHLQGSRPRRRIPDAARHLHAPGRHSRSRWPSTSTCSGQGARNAGVERADGSRAPSTPPPSTASPSAEWLGARGSATQDAHAGGRVPGPAAIGRRHGRPSPESDRRRGRDDGGAAPAHPHGSRSRSPTSLLLAGDRRARDLGQPPPRRRLGRRRAAIRLFPLLDRRRSCRASLCTSPWRSARRASSAGGGLFVTWPQLRMVLSVLLPTALYVAAIPFAGLYVASALLVVWFMMRLGGFRWWTAAAARARRGARRLCRLRAVVPGRPARRGRSRPGSASDAGTQQVMEEIGLLMQGFAVALQPATCC